VEYAQSRDGMTQPATVSLAVVDVTGVRGESRDKHLSPLTGSQTTWLAHSSAGPRARSTAADAISSRV